MWPAALKLQKKNSSPAGRLPPPIKTAKKNRTNCALRARRELSPIQALNQSHGADMHRAAHGLKSSRMMRSVKMRMGRPGAGPRAEICF